MSCFLSLPGRAITVLILGSALILAGCHRRNSRWSAAVATPERLFDMTVKAYKSSQFDLDGAVLSAADLGDHFAYEKDVSQLPRTVLLVPGDDCSVSKQHLQYMARMALDYGFTVYYKDQGILKKINPVPSRQNMTTSKNQ